MSELAPALDQIYFDNNGLPLAGGSLYSYSAGTSTPLATYTDYTNTVANANPVVLDSSGRGQVWLGNSAYKFVLKDSSGNTIWTKDNVRSIEALISSFKINTTAGGTTTMTSADVAQQYWIGSLTQTVKLPTTGIANGQQFTILNRSSGNVTVQASDASAIQIMTSGTQLFLTANIATPVSSSDWTATYVGSATNSVYAAIIGQPSDVTSGAAGYSTWASALAAVNTGDNILILKGTITENVTISKNVNILGEGRGSVLSGTLTFASGCDYSGVRNLKVTGNITVNSGVLGIQFTEFWIPSTASITDNGTASFIQGTQET